MRARGRIVAARHDWGAVAKAHLPLYLTPARGRSCLKCASSSAGPTARETCYSPSLVIKDYFREGESYPLADFLARSREALNIASDRVQAKYGHACSLALGQLARIEEALREIRWPPGRPGERRSL